MTWVHLPHRCVSAPEPTYANPDWGSELLTGAVMVYYGGVLHGRGGSTLITHSKTSRIDGAVYTNADDQVYRPFLDLPTLTLFATGVYLTGHIGDYGTYIGFGYYVDTSDQGLCYTTPWSYSSGAYRGMFRSGPGYTQDPAGSDTLTFPFRGAYGFTITPGSFVNKIVNNGVMYSSAGTYFGSHFTDTRKRFVAAGIGAVVAFNRVVDDKQLLALAGNKWSIFKTRNRLAIAEVAGGEPEYIRQHIYTPRAAVHRASRW